MISLIKAISWIARWVFQTVEATYRLIYKKAEILRNLEDFKGGIVQKGCRI